MYICVYIYIYMCVYIYIYIYVYIYICIGPRVNPIGAVPLGLYTILPLPMLYGTCHTRGGGSRGNRTLRDIVRGQNTGRRNKGGVYFAVPILELVSAPSRNMQRHILSRPTYPWLFPEASQSASLSIETVSYTPICIYIYMYISIPLCPYLFTLSMFMYIYIYIYIYI